MAHIKKMSVVISSTIFCLKLSCQASILYTFVRIIGKFVIPLLSILSSYFLKCLIDILINYSKIDNVLVILLKLSIEILSINLIITIMSKFITYSESIQNDILQNVIMSDVMAKALKSSYQLFDDAEQYNKFSVISTDSNYISNYLWAVLDFMSSLLSFAFIFILLGSNNFIFAILITLTSFPAAISNTKYIKLLYTHNLEQVNLKRKQNYIYHVATQKEYASEIKLYNLSQYLKKRYNDIWIKLVGARKK